MITRILKDKRNVTVLHEHCKMAPNHCSSMRILARCIIFYDSEQRYNSVHCIALQVQKHHHEYSCKTVLTIVLLELQLYFVNYDPVFRSCNYMFHENKL